MPLTSSGCEQNAITLAEQACPAFAEADHLVAEHPRSVGDRADRCVQAGAIAAASQDSDSHGRFPPDLPQRSAYGSLIAIARQPVMPA